MASFLKRRLGSGFLSFLVVIVIFGALGALEYFRILSFFEGSRIAFGYILEHTFGLLLPLGVVAGAYLLNRLFFAQNFYSEKFNEKIKTENNFRSNLSFLNRFGVIGEIIALEIKLILRHKRTKSILYMSGFFLFYGLLFYTNDIYKDNNGFLFFVAMFVTGLLMFMFGQWGLS